MNENDATEQAYKNGYNKGLVYGACGFRGYLIAKADEKGMVHYGDLGELAREYTDILREKEVHNDSTY